MTTATKATIAATVLLTAAGAAIGTIAVIRPPSHVPSQSVAVQHAPAASATDYRKLSQTELVALIKDKLRNDSVTLAPDGPNRYRGTMLSPDETIKLPLEVTVEEQRIVCLSKTAAGSTRNVITPQGLQSDLQMP